jgi:ParB-like chromosome segregation protein Spo0J
MCAALIPYARNARTHSDQQVVQIAASIREFGFTNPVLIDEEDGIIAGHGRVLAAYVVGLEEVPCIVLAHLTPAQRLCARRQQASKAREPPMCSRPRLR